MSWKLVGAITGTLLYVNAAMVFFELAARTMSLSRHVTGSALGVFFVVGSLLLADRFEFPALVASLIVSVGLIIAWAVSERSVPPVVPALLVAVPLVLLNTALFRWAGRVPSTKAAIAILLAMPLVMVAAIVLERRAEAREAAQLEAERASYLRSRQEHLRALRTAVASGDGSRACELFANDADATASDFELCRRWMEASGDAAARWKQIGFFFPPETAHRMKQIGTPEQRQWILRTYSQVWTELPDIEVLQWSGYVREALAQVRGETVSALAPELRARMLKRLEQCLRSPVTNSREDQAQAEGTIAFLKELG